jgi:hypothetical protein
MMSRFADYHDGVADRRCRGTIVDVLLCEARAKRAVIGRRQSPAVEKADSKQQSMAQLSAPAAGVSGARAIQLNRTGLWTIVQISRVQAIIVDRQSDAIVLSEKEPDCYGPNPIGKDDGNAAPNWTNPSPSWSKERPAWSIMTTVTQAATISIMAAPTWTWTGIGLSRDIVRRSGSVVGIGLLQIVSP